MPDKFDPLLSSTRRGFLATTGSVVAGAVAAPRALATAVPQSEDSPAGAPAARRKIPIGVFDPAFPDLTLDQLVDKYASLGVEAAEIGTGGYPNNKHCPIDDLLADPAKLNAWRKKFDDRNIQIATLSCHANPNWITYRWPPEYAAAQDWQWKEKVVPYWKGAAKFAREHGVHRLALEMHPNFMVYNPLTLLKLREAVGEEIGANNDLSHLFWQGCDPVEVIHLLGKQGAIFHAHMKDTVLYKDNLAKYGVLNFVFEKDDLKRASDAFRAVGYGHSATLWKDVIRAYMDVGYEGILSVENEDPILSGAVGVDRALYVLKNVREELLTETV